MSRSTPPFKFLESYQKKDAAIFFGREEETKAIYEALSGVKLLLVYGPSGAGKTSLVECGLRNQFSDADWFALSIRRGNHITASTFAAINRHLQDKIDMGPDAQLPADPGIDFGQAAKRLFDECYKPIYLLFDQFEELLISGDDAEKEDFFKRLNRLIHYRLPCRVLLIMREEFIGALSEFETYCPSIFQHRFRLEKMTLPEVKKVVRNILEAPYYQQFFTVADSEKLAGEIISRLPDRRREVELSHVQVFLGELWRRAEAEKGEGQEKHRLHSGLVRKEDNLERVLDRFLSEQLEKLEREYGKKEPFLEVLAAMITDGNTKLQLSEAELRKSLAEEEALPAEPLWPLLRKLEGRRLIRPIQSGNQTRYEISHDVLAIVVGQNLTEEMQLRRKASEKYRHYEERLGLLSQDELDDLRLYGKYLPYPQSLEEKIEKSTKGLEDRKRQELVKARRRVQLLGAAFAVVATAFVLAGYFGWKANQQRKYAQEQFLEAQSQRQIAEDERKKAELALEDFLREQAEKGRLQFNLLAERANTILEVGGCPKEVFQDMQNIAREHPDSTAMVESLDALRQLNPQCR